MCDSCEFGVFNLVKNWTRARRNLPNYLRTGEKTGLNVRLYVVYVFRLGDGCDPVFTRCFRSACHHDD